MHSKKATEQNVELSNDHVRIAITEYLRAEQIDGAFMIDGAWGSGKTYFYQHTIEEVIKNSDKKPIYISLYGISNISEVESQIVAQLIRSNDAEAPRFDLVKQKWWRIFANIIQLNEKLAMLLNFMTGLAKDSLCSKKHVLCFDDLERVKLSPGIMLGYINQFVEHASLPTLIICNEAELIRNNVAGEDRNEYLVIKEKLIRHTNKYMTPIGTAVEIFLPILDEKLQNKIRQNIQVVDDCISASGDVNLRSIKSCFLNMKAVYGVIPADVDTEAIDEYLLRLIFSLTLEERTGKPIDELQAWAHDGFDESYIAHMIAMSGTQNEDVDKEIPYNEGFLKKYYSDFADAPVLVFPEIYDYIQSGYFAESGFVERIKELTGRADDVAKLFPMHWHKMNDADFAATSDAFIADLKAGKYCSAKMLISYSGWLLAFAEWGLISITVDEVKKLFEDLVKDLYNDGKFRHTDEIDVLVMSAYTPENENIRKIQQEIIKTIKDGNEQAQYLAHKNEIQSLQTKLSDNTDVFFRGVYQEAYRYIPIMSLFDIKQLSADVLALENRYIHEFASFIDSRYRVGPINIMLDDRPALQTLRQNIEKAINELSNKAGSVHRQNLLILKDELAKAIAILDSSKKVSDQSKGGSPNA